VRLELHERPKGACNALEVRQGESVETTATSGTALALLGGGLFADMLGEVVLEGTKDLHPGLVAGDEAANGSTNRILLVPGIHTSHPMVEGEDSLVEIGDQGRRETGNARAFAFGTARASDLDVLLKGSANTGVTYCQSVLVRTCNACVADTYRIGGDWRSARRSSR